MEGIGYIILVAAIACGIVAIVHGINCARHKEWGLVLSMAVSALACGLSAAAVAIELFAFT